MAPTPFTNAVTKCLHVEHDDLAGLPLSALGAMATLGSYYYLQPLGDTLALAMGLEYTPLVTVGNMCLIVALNPLYAAAVTCLPVKAVLPFMFRIVSGILLCFAFAFHLFPTYRPLSFAFAVYVGTISLFTTTTFYGRLASLHSKAAAKRVYGIVAAGAQSGQLLSSITAPLLFDRLGNMIVVCAAAVYECAVQLMLCRSAIKPAKLDSPTASGDSATGPASAGPASGGRAEQRCQHGVLNFHTY